MGAITRPYPNCTVWDFVGFTYGDYHCVRDLGIYRVSDGSRYNENLVGQTSDITAQATGMDGTYFFKSTRPSKTITINFAFDNLSEEKLHLLRKVFNGTEIKELVFDETPYKAWDAKVSGAPNIKYICFSEDRFSDNDLRTYKGEGSVTFICFNPYAHTPTKLWSVNDAGKYIYTVPSGDYAEYQSRVLDNYNEDYYTNKEEWKTASGLKSGKTHYKGGDVPTYFVAKYAGHWSKQSMTVDGKTITPIALSGYYYHNVTWYSKIGIVKAQVTLTTEDPPENTPFQIINCEGDLVATIAAEPGVALELSNVTQIKYQYLYL